MNRLALLCSIALTALLASCSVNEYCLNCAVPGDGGGEGGTGDADDGGDGDAPDADPCVPTGVEVCDNEDNDCNGTVDDNISGLGAACANQMGECAGGVTQCTNGALTCTRPPMPEICDLKDNNCNGTADEGDPGGGAACGTNVGECTAGVRHCNLLTGVVECEGAIGTVGGQPELCNGRDDDCDTMFDEGLGSLGSCGATDVGECSFGTLACMGGGPICMGDQGPTFESCDNLDNDCDNVVDNGYNKLTDPQNCNACGNVCSAPNAISGCAGGACTIASCNTGFHNNNGVVSDGCEYGPCQANGAEVCDGIDNNCDGLVDNGLTPPSGLCRTVGACAGSTVSCQGAMGWRCNYNASVSTDGMGNIIAETRCDTVDNDCDTKIDENQPNKGLACSDTGLGECQGTGNFICNSANLDGPAVCNITDPGATAQPESCNGLDDDCNGVADNGAATGNLVGQDWVALGNGEQMMKYEASRPDATGLSQGVSTATTCSRAGAIPWTNVTYPQAEAACSAVGARLCTEGEWHRTCSVVPSQTYPVAVPAAGAFSLTLEAEDYAGIATGTSGVTRSWSPSYTPGFFKVSAMEAGPNTGANLSTAALAIAGSPRLDFALTMAATRNLFVCVRTFSPAPNPTQNDRFYVGIGGTLQAQVTPVDNAWTWTGPTPAISAAAGARNVSIYIQDDGIRIDRVHISTTASCPANANPPAGDAGGKWAYMSAPNTFQPGVCNSDELDADLPPADAGNQDDILPAGSLSACYANDAGGSDVYDMSGNVKEWTARRQPGQNPIRGGSSNNTPDGISCPLNFTLADDDFFFPNVGFRCCR